MGRRNADQVKKDLASCEKQRKAAKAKQERREKELAAKAAKDKKPDICECDEASCES